MGVFCGTPSTRSVTGVQSVTAAATPHGRAAGRQTGTSGRQFAQPEPPVNGSRTEHNPQFARCRLGRDPPRRALGSLTAQSRLPESVFCQKACLALSGR